jgi:hypothetical protein
MCSGTKMAILAVVLFAHSGVFAVEYFPSEPGPEFVYGQSPLEIQSSDLGGFLRVSCPDCNIMSYTRFLIGPSGNVFLGAHGSASTGAPDPDETYFEPNLKYLDFPLEPAKTWSSTAVQFDLWGGEEDTVTLTATVQGQEVVSVPAGEFEVMVVDLAYTYETQMWMNRIETLWLHAQLGPVKNLVSWTGVVDTEKTSMSAVKALYR